MASDFRTLKLCKKPFLMLEAMSFKALSFAIPREQTMSSQASDWTSGHVLGTMMASHGTVPFTVLPRTPQWIYLKPPLKDGQL